MKTRRRKNSLCTEICTRLIGMTVQDLIEQRESFQDSLKKLSDLTNHGPFNIQEVFCPNRYRSLVDGVVKVDHLDPNAEAWDLYGKSDTMNVSLNEWLPMFRVGLWIEGPYFGNSDEYLLEDLPSDAKVYKARVFTNKIVV